MAYKLVSETLDLKRPSIGAGSYPLNYPAPLMPNPPVKPSCISHSVVALQINTMKVCPRTCSQVTIDCM